MEEWYNKIVSPGAGTALLSESWEAWLDFVDEHALGARRVLKTVELETEVLSLREQIRHVFATEPPSESVDTFYVAILETVDSSGDELVVLCLAGVRGFSEEDQDTLCEPSWWPAGRYLRCGALNVIKTLEPESEGERESFLAYAGRLGTACLVSRAATRGVIEPRMLVVGLDSGDVVVLRNVEDEVSRQ